MRMCAPLLTLLLGSWLIGCTKPQPSSHFHVEVERIVETPKLVVARLTLSFAERRRVRVSGFHTDISSVTESSSPSTEAPCVMILVADLIDWADSGPYIRWYWALQGSSVKSSGQPILPVQGVKSLGNILTIETGDYPFGSGVDLVDVAGRSVRLSVTARLSDAATSSVP